MWPLCTIPFNKSPWFMIRVTLTCPPSLCSFLNSPMSRFCIIFQPHESQLSWWLQAQPIIDLDIWVDTSTYGGVGVLVAGLWATWKLVFGLSSMAQDISWEVVVTINLAVVWLVQKGQHDTCL